MPEIPTSSQMVDSSDLNLDTVFKEFYVVPDYQREYVWEEEQVEQLLGDIYTEFSADGRATPSEYFIGSIVVCPKGNGTFELIDGQQRVTTIYLFLCALRDHLTSPGKALEAQIAATSVDENGNDVDRCRVDLQYEDSRDILEQIARGVQPADSIQGDTKSIANICEAYRVIRTFINREFPDNEEELKRFYAYMIRNVKLIRIRTQSVAHALKIFETINDRGKGLDSMDLLKNLMFMHSKPGDFDKLKQQWKELVDTLFAAKEKPLRFLRYYILASYDVDRLREEEIYDWFLKNEKLCGFHDDPLGFSKQLLGAAKAYGNMLTGKDSHGQPNRYLLNIRALGGAARQHLILLMAARQLDGSAFNELCRQTENLFFAYIITRENTREFERKFAIWAKDLRKVKGEQDLQDFLARTFAAAKGELSLRFDLAFKGLGTDVIQKYRLRYILAKITQHVDEQAYGNASGRGSLDFYINRKVHIEHILPDTPSADALMEFDKPEQAKAWSRRLGNLTFAEEAINTSLGNKAFSVKKEIYPESSYMLTRCLSRRPEIGVTTQIDVVARSLPTFKRWYTEDIEARQNMMTKLARQVWEIPSGIGAPA